MTPDLKEGPARWALRGVMHALAYPAWTVALALAGVGSLARDAGHPVWAAMASTVFLWAGPAQVIFYGGIAAGMAPAALAMAVCLSSIRLLPMTLSIVPLLRQQHHGLGRLVFAAHYVAVTAWVEGMRRLPFVPPPARMSYFLGFANACLVVSTIATALGYFLMGALPVPLAAGMLFITPVFFSISVAAGARQASAWLAIILGFVLEPVALRWVGDSADLLVVGLVGGTAAFLLARKRGEA